MAYPIGLRNATRADARGESLQAHATLTVNVREQQVTKTLRNCRATIGVDVSGSMNGLIDSVINGIGAINSALDDSDLVSVVRFSKIVKTVFGYRKRPAIDWNRLRDTLTDLVVNNPGGHGNRTALWDAIGEIIDNTPRDSKYSDYKPEIIIFTDGHDNNSREYDYYSIQERLEKPGISHVHITIIDASPGGNPQLNEICAPIEHCSYMRVEASGEAIHRAFKNVIRQITSRLRVDFPVFDTDALSAAMSGLGLGSRGPATIATPSVSIGGNPGEYREGEGSGHVGGNENRGRNGESRENRRGSRNKSRYRGRNFDKNWRGTDESWRFSEL